MIIEKGMEKPRPKRTLEKVRARVRTGAGFAVGLILLALVDLWFYFLPRLTGRLRRCHE